MEVGGKGPIRAKGPSGREFGPWGLGCGHQRDGQHDQNREHGGCPKKWFAQPSREWGGGWGEKFELFGWSGWGFEAFDEGSTFCIDGTAVQGWIVEVGWILSAAVVDVESLQVGRRIDLSADGRIFVKI